jgi:hypothetical protein
VSEFYAQLSKFSTWIIAIVQQYSRFQRSGIRPIVFGNAKQFFFTRANDRRDVEDVARDIELSQATKEAITRYPLPEHLPPHNKYASLTYYHLDVQQPLCGTIHNRVSKEMLYCSSSTGETSTSAAGSCVRTITSFAEFSPKLQRPSPHEDCL